MIEMGTTELIMIAMAIIILLVLVPFAIIDTIRSTQHSVVQKVAWIVFIIIAPYLGSIVYLFWGRRQKTL